MKINTKKIEFFFFRLFEKLVHLIGFAKIKYIAKPFAYLFYYVFPIRKKVVIKNLAYAFPEKSETEIKNLAFKNYYSSALMFLEMLYLSKITQSDFEKIIEIDDETKQRLISYASDEKGTIFLTGHFGNWELVGLFVGNIVSNIKRLNVLAKRQHNEYISNWLEAMRTRTGNKVVYVGKSTKELFKIVLNKEIVALVADQRGKKEGMKIKFFGIDTPIHTGLAVIALKTKTPIVLILATRIKPGLYKLTIEELRCEKLSEKWHDNEKCLMQKYMSAMEEYIRENPEQWFWMHNIWKYSI